MLTRPPTPVDGRVLMLPPLPPFNPRLPVTADEPPAPEFAVIEELTLPPATVRLPRFTPVPMLRVMAPPDPVVPILPIEPPVPPVAVAPLPIPPVPATTTLPPVLPS